MKTLALTAALVALVGCASTQSIQATRQGAQDEAEQAVEYLQEMRSGASAAKSATAVTVIREGHYMPLRTVEVDRLENDPLKCSIEYNPVSPATLPEIGQAISENCGVRVRITPDAMSAIKRMSSGKAGANMSASRDDQGQMALGLPELPPLNGIPMFGAPGNKPELVNITWSGEIGGLLDAVTSRLGLSWRHREGVVSIFYLDTRIYRIDAIPSTSTMRSVVQSGAQSSAGVSTGGSSGSSDEGGISGTSGSNQMTSVELETDFMQDLEDTIGQMLTPEVGRMALSRSSGGLTVTDTPEMLDRIQIYIDDLNEFATKQVLLNVRVLSVTLSDNNEMGINWNAIYTSLADQYGLKLANSLTSASEAISGSVSILEGSNSRFSGSDLVVKALSQEGRVSVLTQPSVTTLNLEPVPVQVARQVSYLERVELGQTAQVGSTTSLTPGSVTTGFNMMLLPHILDDSKTVLLQYTMNLSSLDNLRSVSSGGSSIEIPEIDNRIFNQKVRLQSNETLIISGFEQVTNDSRRNGVGSSSFWGLGGGVKADSRRDVIVVLITPIVLG